MQIAGIQKTTLVDYEGLVASTVFTRSCSFRCPFCHNPELVLPEQFIPLMDNDEIWRFFESRVGKIDGICITGGEPVLQPDLGKFMQGLKQLGFKVKLDSNGYDSKKLARLIKEGNIDYLAMDIKAPLLKYSQVAYAGFLTENITPSKIRSLKENIQSSIKLIMNSDIEYEFRTTVVKPLHSIDDMIGIGKLIKGAQKYYIQNFIPSKQISDQKFESFSEADLQKMKATIEPYVKLTQIR